MEYTNLGRTGLKVSRLCLGTMNFGPQDRQSRTASPSWTGHSSTASTSSTPPTSTAGSSARGSPSRSSGAGSRRAGAAATRSCWPRRSYGKMADWPNELGPVRPAHHQGVRRLAAPAADRLDRPLPDAPRRPDHPLGRDLAGDGDAGRAGQGTVRRLVQLRRLAPRPGAGRRRAPALPRSRLRAVHLQPAHPVRRAGGHPGRDRVRDRHHPVVPAATAACSPAYCASSGRAPRPGRWKGAPARPSPSSGRPSRRTRSWPPSSGTTRPTWRWPGCCPAPA